LVSYTNEENILRVFEKRVLRTTYEPKREKITGGWTKLHNEGLHNLYSSQSTLRVIKLRRMSGAELIARLEEVRNAYKFLVGKSEGNSLVGRPRHKWQDNIKMDPKGGGYEKIVWILAP
jgi:hypothetical protein